MPDSTRILVVDDHAGVRHELKSILSSEEGWEVVAEAMDGVEAVDKASRLVPDVIVLDISMPRMNGLEACRRIKGFHPQCEVLVVTQHDAPQMVREAANAGARGYLLKSNAARDLLRAVRSVSRHQAFNLVPA